MKYAFYINTSKHKQAHLFGIILETFWLKLIGQTQSTCDTELFCYQSGSTEAIFSATESKYARYEPSSEKMLLTFSLVSTPCLFWDSDKAEDKI